MVARDVEGERGTTSPALVPSGPGPPAARRRPLCRFGMEELVAVLGAIVLLVVLEMVLVVLEAATVPRR